eukprot:6570181-Alexandrium_andersonii.AAC.1
MGRAVALLRPRFSDGASGGAAEGACDPASCTLPFRAGRGCGAWRLSAGRACARAFGYALG